MAQNRKKVEFAASYYSTADDIATITKVVRDVGGVRTALQIRVQHYKGKPYIIFKGFPGQRQFFNAARYGADNPKIISMALGKLGAFNAIKNGGFISIVICTPLRVVEYFLRDEATLYWLVGTLATDIVKCVIACGAGFLAALFAGTVFVSAIGPIIFALMAGILSSIGLNLLDEKLGITNHLIQGLEEFSNIVNNGLTSANNKFKNFSHSVERRIDHSIDKFENAIFDFVVDGVGNVLYKSTKDIFRKKIYQNIRVMY